MKVFEDYKFDLDEYKNQLEAFNQFLLSKSELSERDEILPFFQKNKHLAAQIGTIHPNIIRIERLAFEYDIFGDFACDLAVGDASNNSYCFIEFEDAKKESIFKKNGKKYKHEFSPRLEHGVSQIIDWFYKFDGLQNSDSLEERFGVHKIEYEGILVIGRSSFVNLPLKRRLDWRFRHTVIHSRRIQCFTFDELYNTLVRKLSLLERMVR